MKTLTVLCLLLAATALAEAQKPKLAVHPLVLQGVDNKHDREELTALLPGIVIAVGKVEIASPSDVDAELKKKGVAFCADDNLFKCLTYIAEHTSSVHALRIELRRGGRPNEWELLANVICVDGSVQRQPEIFTFSQNESVKFLPMARAKLEEFIATLKLGELPLAPPVKAAAVEPPPKPGPPPPSAPPGVLEHPPTTPPLRIGSYASGALAVAALATGTGLLIAAKNDSTTLTNATGPTPAPVPRALLPTAVRLESENTAGAVCLAIGGAAAAAAVTLFFLGGDESTPVVTAAPVSGGGALVFSSRF